ncbi:unnamed protein product [Miscanthus lutarioriparius]|uniref:Alcohol dehydrogenase-like N-terminal domain-containing protein n=1 Tax=Miscanthus lutarioriparius TaxID=422564 RepID=A0A811M8I5_9POAL|nr:unnamed protein product [Miscanthus lutarioriparius]
MTNGNGGAGGTRGKAIKCKAAVAWGPGVLLSLEEVEVAPPGPLEVRVKVLFTSICHTDLSAWKGENEVHRKYPRILGHEAAGCVILILFSTHALRFFFFGSLAAPSPSTHDVSSETELCRSFESYS